MTAIDEDSELQRIILESLADARTSDGDAALALRLQEEDDRLVAYGNSAAYRSPARGNAGRAVPVVNVDSSDDEDDEEVWKAMYESMKPTSTTPTASSTATTSLPFVPTSTTTTTTTTSTSTTTALPTLHSTYTAYSTPPATGTELTSALRTSKSLPSVPTSQQSSIPPQRVSSVTFSDFVSTLPHTAVPSTLTPATAAPSSSTVRSTTSAAAPFNFTPTATSSFNFTPTTIIPPATLNPTPTFTPSSAISTSTPAPIADITAMLGGLHISPERASRTHHEKNNKPRASKPHTNPREASGNVGIPGNSENPTNTSNNNNNYNSSTFPSRPVPSGERKVLKPKKSGERKGGRIANPFPPMTPASPSNTSSTPTYSPVRITPFPLNTTTSPATDPAINAASTTANSTPNYAQRFGHTTFHTSTTNTSVNIADDLRSFALPTSPIAPAAPTSPYTPTLPSLPTTPPALQHSQASSNVYSNSGYANVNTPPANSQPALPPAPAATPSHSLFNIPSYFQPSPAHNLIQPPTSTAQQTTRANENARPYAVSAPRAYYQPQYRTPQQVLPVYQPSNTGNVGSARGPIPSRNTNVRSYSHSSSFSGTGHRLGNGTIEDDEAFAQSLQLQEALQAQREYDLLNSRNGRRAQYDDDSLAQQYQYEELMAMRRMQGSRFYDDSGSDYSDEDGDPADENDVDHMSYEQLLALEERIGHVSRGASKADIDSCPKFTLTAENPENNTCLVCQDDMTIGHVVRRLPCMHMYHQPCIDQWLGQKATCPVCQHAIKE